MSQNLTADEALRLVKKWWRWRNEKSCAADRHVISFVVNDGSAQTVLELPEGPYTSFEDYLTQLALETPVSEGMRFAVAREVLTKLDKSDDAEALALARELQRAVRQLREELFALGSEFFYQEKKLGADALGIWCFGTPPQVPAERNGMLAWDAVLAEHARALGKQGKKFASIIQARASTRWQEYLEGANNGFGLHYLWLVGCSPVARPVERFATAIVEGMRADTEWPPPGDNCEGPEKAWREVGRVLTEEEEQVVRSAVRERWGSHVLALSPRAAEDSPLLAALNSGRPNLGPAFGRWNWPPFVTNLARALWLEVGPRLERDRRKPPSVVRPVHANLGHLLSHAPKLDGKNLSLDYEGHRLAALEVACDLDVVRRGLDVLRTVAGYRLIQWEVRTGHERVLQGEPDPRLLVVEGGWTALASLLGFAKAEKYAGDVRSAVRAQDSLKFRYPDGTQGSMLSFTEKPAAGRERARVVITLGSPLLPGYVFNMPRADRKLIPVLRKEPPLYGRPNEHGAQLALSWAVLGELRERAPELVEEGGAWLPIDTWGSLADRVGLPRRLVVPVREAWINGDTRAPPMLARVGTRGRDAERYTLADAHKAERDFLEEGGRLELQGAIAGRKSIAKKRAKLARRGKRPKSP